VFFDLNGNGTDKYDGNSWMATYGDGPKEDNDDFTLGRVASMLMPCANYCPIQVTMGQIYGKFQFCEL